MTFLARLQTLTAAAHDLAVLAEDGAAAQDFVQELAAAKAEAKALVAELGEITELAAKRHAELKAVEDQLRQRRLEHDQVEASLRTLRGLIAAEWAKIDAAIVGEERRAAR
jgi:hypothetical protein